VLLEIAQLRNEGLRGVVLSSRWLGAFTSPPYEVAAGAGDHDSDADPSVQGTEGALALASTIRRLTSLGLKVLIMAPTPQMRYDIPSCLARRNPDQCDVDRSTIDGQRRAVMQLFLHLASRSPNVRVFDPIDSLCSSTTCFAARDGRVIYRDDDHITATASRGLLPAASTSLRWVSAPAGTAPIRSAMSFSTPQDVSALPR